MKYRYPGVIQGGIFADSDEAKAAFCRMKLEEQELLEEQEEEQLRDELRDGLGLELDELRQNAEQAAMARSTMQL